MQDNINLFTERLPCSSCSNVISDKFAKLYSNVEVRFYHNNGEITVYRASSSQIVKVPDSSKLTWSSAHDLHVIQTKKKGK
ncbi:viroplasmin and RNaseH domain-containing protein [Chitinivorax tropicus]|uniref:Viroplasmin and RNaseH domain-containing protein n=1 Tax=Chitinivorax tropicus TaxID=714531 RepID=A0A840MVN5_9PROT|nr:viroplasmin and RNaseH domain-containing protein [Chitinivorax tropicus]